MKKVIKKRKKICPMCKKEYAEEYNYCRDDGSRLEPAPPVHPASPVDLTATV